MNRRPNKPNSLRKLLLYATFKFFIAVLVESYQNGAQYNGNECSILTYELIKLVICNTIINQYSHSCTSCVAEYKK